MNHNKVKIFSFFSGCGFLDLGFENNGYEISFVNELSTSFLSAYKYSRRIMGLPKPEFGYWNTDINEYFTTRCDELNKFIIDARSNDSIIGFIGGPPCPDFSVGGKNKGRYGDNGKLSLSYVKLITEKQPDFFLFENVKGLWRTARHREFFEELKTMLHAAGYCTTERLTNALEFGVAQDRDRILLIGIRKVFLGNEHINGNQIIDFPWNSHIKYSLKEVKELPWLKTTPFVENSSMDCPDDIYEDLTVQYWFNKNHVETHPNAKDHFTPRSGLLRMQSIDEGDDNKKSYKRLHRWRYSPTAAYGNNEVHLHPYYARRISAAEAMAIQSLPSNFVLPSNMTLSDMFKTIGNGVPYLLSAGIAQTLHEYLEVSLCRK